MPKSAPNKDKHRRARLHAALDKVLDKVEAEGLYPDIDPSYDEGDQFKLWHHFPGYPKPEDWLDVSEHAHSIEVYDLMRLFRDYHGNNVLFPCETGEWTHTRRRR